MQLRRCFRKNTVHWYFFKYFIFAVAYKTSFLPIFLLVIHEAFKLNMEVRKNSSKKWTELMQPIKNLKKHFCGNPVCDIHKNFLYFGISYIKRTNLLNKNFFKKLFHLINLVHSLKKYL